MAQGRAPAQPPPKGSCRGSSFKENFAARVAAIHSQHSRAPVVVFMDEGRFGRISQLAACWAPMPVRPKVPRQIVRESLYAFAAVVPAPGKLVYRLSAKCNTEAMSLFLLDVLEAWPDSPVLLVLDGAGWHKARTLPVPDRLILMHLPPYCPECNPTEHIWDEVREKGFANHLFATLEAVQVRLIIQLEELAADTPRLRGLTHFSWLSPKLLYV